MEIGTSSAAAAAPACSCCPCSAAAARAAADGGNTDRAAAAGALPRPLFINGRLIPTTDFECCRAAPSAAESPESPSHYKLPPLSPQRCAAPRRAHALHEPRQLRLEPRLRLRLGWGGGSGAHAAGGRQNASGGTKAPLLKQPLSAAAGSRGVRRIAHAPPPPPLSRLCAGHRVAPGSIG